MKYSSNENVFTIEVNFLSIFIDTLFKRNQFLVNIKDIIDTSFIFIVTLK
jgi:hypothetical protein